ncbi:MAG: ribonuclease H-like YkuK family protein [Candidatus Brennerbacteria bacterium]|nr:ribonuclease H-like YkuK family protein [Candidatus Brennerbacteria bacterium]
MPVLFNSSFGLRLTPKQVVDEVIRFMLAEPNRRYKVIIGTDSEKTSGDLADFVTAIVVHRVGNGGRYFWRHVTFDKFYTLRDRILKEVMLSLEIAQDVFDEFSGQQTPKFDFEIHVDVGENGPTKTMIQEVVGMIRAHNFEVRTKPDSYAASKVADRHV